MRRRRSAGRRGAVTSRSYQKGAVPQQAAAQQEEVRSMAVVKVDPAKGIPKVVLKVGFNQPATYKSWVRYPDGTKHSLGPDNEVDLAAAPKIQTASDLIGKTFEWDVRVISIAGGPNEKYRLAVHFTQDGIPIHEPIVLTGKFEGNAAWLPDSALFI